VTGRWIFAQEGVGTNDEERTFRKLKSSGVNHGYEVGYLSGGEGDEDGAGAGAGAGEMP